MIEGKVARVLNSRELVINRGGHHGVAPGMVFVVMNPAGDEINDPDTGEPLGEVNRPKVQVKVLTVRPQFAIARTFEKTGGSSGILGPDMSTLFYGKPATYRTLRSDDALWEPITEEESYVKIGDPVRQVVDE